MLKNIDIKNLTVFKETGKLSFSPGLNMIIGENGAGKSHLLKLIYSVLAVSSEEGKKHSSEKPKKNQLQNRMAEKLSGVFRIETLGRLARRKQGRERCTIQVEFTDQNWNMGFSFGVQSKSEVSIEQLPLTWIDQAPVFLPTRELLTLYPNFISVYDNHYLEFEETYRDTCLLLGSLAIRGPREKKVKLMLAPLEETMGGKVELNQNGRFYLKSSGLGVIEMSLVAEGLRKFAMLSQLITTGSLLDKGTLFWDEPEANLNPKLVKFMAKSILDLCLNGIQIFLATHSLFLMREIEILLNQETYKKTNARFFSLNKEKETVQIHQAATFAEIDSITSLDEELIQSDRFMELTPPN